MTINELIACLQNPAFDFLEEMIEEDPNLPLLLLNAMDFDKTETLNFADYLFFRKTALAWKTCSIDN